MPTNPRKEAKEVLNASLREANKAYDVAVARAIEARSKKAKRAWQIYRKALKKIEEGKDGTNRRIK